MIHTGDQAIPMAKKSKKIPPAPHVQSLEEARTVIDDLWVQLHQPKRSTPRANSRNSSAPPSADGPEVKRDEKPKSENPQGAQSGHRGHKRAQVPEDEVDEVFKYFPQSHCCCGGQIIPNDKPFYRHQVFELPEPQHTVFEHQLYQGCCEHCCQTYQARLPDTVSETQMGPNLITYIALQAGQFHQSIQKIQLQLKQNYGLYFSTGAISEAQGRSSAMLTPLHQAIKHEVSTAEVRHADETRHQRGSEKRWMWLMCCKTAAFFMTHYSRGRSAAKKLLGEDPSGVTVTDRYVGYSFIDDEKRQFCWAHVLRNVIAIAESTYPEKAIGERLAQIIRLLFHEQHRYEQGEFNRAQYQQRMHRIRRLWLKALTRGAERCNQQHFRNRCEQLLKDDAMGWTFLEYPGVPLTNNEAERAIRGYVLWRKGSYGVRSHRGELFRQRILSLVGTAQLKGVCPQKWLNAIIRSCIEKTPYPLMPI